jgi:predicted PurR-regulated permease PerM
MRDMDMRKKQIVNKPEQMVSAVSTQPVQKRGLSRISSTKLRVLVGFVVVLVLVSGFLTFKYLQINHQIKQLKSNSNSVIANSTEKLLTKVGNLALLPQGTPTIAIVKNVNQLKSEAFFDGAQNGDYLIVYAQAKKAILYRPSDNRIVEYANTN